MGDAWVLSRFDKYFTTVIVPRTPDLAGRMLRPSVKWHSEFSAVHGRIKNYRTSCYTWWGEMVSKRVFKTKTFSRWARNLVPDADLCAAAREIEQGLFEADLGKGLCKKRIGIQGRGKSGALRTLVAKRHPAAIVFLFGREKSAPGDDFPDAVVEAAKIIATATKRNRCAGTFGWGRRVKGNLRCREN